MPLGELERERRLAARGRSCDKHRPPVPWLFHPGPACRHFKPHDK
jgi:hypothetical protein